MFRRMDSYRFGSPQTVLLTAALGVSVLVGCRNTGRQSPVLSPAAAPLYSDASPASTVPPPLLLGTDAQTVSPLPESAQAFRPITPETVSTPNTIFPSVPAPKAETASVEPILQKKIDDLSNKIVELEKKLANKEEELKRSLLPTPIPDAPKPISTTAASPPPKTPPVLPAISVAGVSSAIDGEKVRIQIPDSVLFQPGTMRLTPEGEDALRSIASEIRTRYPQGFLDFEGHTDNLQTDPTNATQKHDVASLKSMVVVQYFVQNLQWKPETISTSGFGSSRPLAENGTPEGRAKNNRIEIVVRP